MPYLEPTGHVECDGCAELIVVEMEPIADGSGGFDAFQYSDDLLPEDWKKDSDGIWCPYCGSWRGL
jgi:hypothetical protein